MQGMHQRIEAFGPLAAPRDAAGHAAVAGTSLGTFWGRVEQTGSSEGERAGGTVLRRVYEITLRSSTADAFGIDERCSLRWGQVLMEIDAPAQRDPRSDYVTLTAIEVR